MKDEYNVKKSRPLKSFKASLQNKKNCDKNKEKTISFLLPKMMALTHIHTEIKPVVRVVIGTGFEFCSILFQR